MTMKIHFERTGGFANIRFTGSFDLDSMPEEIAQSLKMLLEQVDFATLPEQLPGDAAVPDQFNYTITVTTSAWQHTVVTGDRTAPEALRPLLQKLTELARAQTGKSKP
jgi:hypothetical protein